MEQFKYVCENCYLEKHKFIFFNNINDIYKHLAKNPECENKVSRHKEVIKQTINDNRKMLLFNIITNYDDDYTFEYIQMYNVSRRLYSCL